MMGLRQQLSDAMKAALKAKETQRLSAIRLILAAIQEKDVAARTQDISDDEILSLLARMVKQREESAATYDGANRPELAAKERDEIAVIREFLPQQMAPDEAKAAAQGVIAELGASSPKDMGKVMAALKERYAGRMDFGKASGLVKELLATPKG
jgi:uncharacterized protein YqeY